MKVKPKFLLSLVLLLLLYNVPGVVYASEPEDSNSITELTELADYETSFEHEYDDSSYFIRNVREVLVGDRISKLSSDYALLKEFGNAWRNGEDITDELIKEVEVVTYKYLYEDDAKHRSSAPSWEQWQNISDPYTFETFVADSLRRVTRVDQKKVVGYKYIGQYSSWTSTRLYDHPDRRVETRTAYSQDQYKRYKITCTKKTLFITQTKNYYFSGVAGGTICSSGYTQKSAGWEYTRTKNYVPSGEAWVYDKKITEYGVTSGQSNYVTSTEYRYAIRIPTYQYQTAEKSSVELGKAPKVQYSNDSGGYNFLLFGPQGSIKDSNGNILAENIYGEGNLQITRYVYNNATGTDIIDTTNGEFYLGKFLNGITENSGARATYRAKDGTTYPSAYSFTLKYRNSIGYTDYKDLDNICGAIHTDGVDTSAGSTATIYSCSNVGGLSYESNYETIYDAMYFYMRDKDDYLAYTGMTGDNATKEARITKLLTEDEGTFHRGFTNMVRSNGDVPNRSIHYFRNQLQDGIAPDTYDEFKASPNYKNWIRRSDSESEYHTLDEGKYVQGDPNYKPQYNRKYVSVNGNFEVIYNPDLGAPTGQYSKRGKLIDMEYDHINMGTYNYVFSISEVEAPWNIILDLPQSIESYPHLKFDIYPYADQLKEGYLGDFIDFFKSGENYGNTWQH